MRHRAWAASFVGAFALQTQAQAPAVAGLIVAGDVFGRVSGAATGQQQAAADGHAVAEKVPTAKQ